MSLLESRALPLPCNTHSLSLSLFFLAPLFLLSVCQSRLWRSLSSSLQGDTVDMPWAKGNLFCTSNMHHVAVSVDSTSRKCERDRKAYIDLSQCAHSPCYSCQEVRKHCRDPLQQRERSTCLVIGLSRMSSSMINLLCPGFVGQINIQ